MPLRPIVALRPAIVSRTLAAFPAALLTAREAQLRTGTDARRPDARSRLAGTRIGRADGPVAPGRRATADTDGVLGRAGRRVGVRPGCAAGRVRRLPFPPCLEPAVP